MTTAKPKPVLEPCTRCWFVLSKPYIGQEVKAWRISDDPKEAALHASNTHRGWGVRLVSDNVQTDIPLMLPMLLEPRGKS